MSEPIEPGNQDNQEKSGEPLKPSRPTGEVPHHHHIHIPVVEELLANTEEGERRRRSLFHKIVNIILAIGGILFVGFLVLFAFTQTATFRGIVRNELLSTLNSAINGRLSIESIDGTFFTNLTVRNAVLANPQGDTIISVRSARVRVKPLQLLLNTIYIKNIHLEGVKARLLKDSAGVYNIAKVFPSSEDTTSSNFRYRIKVDFVQLHESEILLCDENLLEDKRSQPFFNLSNFRAKSIELSFGAEAMVFENEFILDVTHLSCETNISGVGIRNLSGNFRLTPRFAAVDELRLVTSRSDIVLNARMEEMNVFKGGILGQLAVAPIKAHLHAAPFHFDDLTAFVPATKILKGPVIGDIVAGGTLTALFVEKLDLAYGNSHLKITGALQNILDGADMKIRAVSTDSRIVLADVPKLLPMVQLPTYRGYENVAFDSLYYEGTPLNFEAKFRCSTGGGTLAAQAKFNFIPEIAEYVVEARTANLDLEAFTAYRTAFNGKIAVNGAGFNPRTMNTSLLIDGDYSVIGDRVYNQLRLNGTLRDAALESSLTLKSAKDSLLLSLQGEMIDDSTPSYSILLNTHGFDLAPPLQDSTLQSDLNLSLRVEGRGLDFNTLKGNASLKVQPSRIFGKPLEGFGAQLRVNGKMNNYKEILFTSDICDIDLHGVFSIGDFGALVKKEIDSLKTTITDKIGEILPTVARRISESKAPVTLTSIKSGEAAVPKIDASFTLKVKDIAQISAFMEGYDIALEGRLRGNLKFEKSVFSLECIADLPFLKFNGKDKTIFFSDAKLNLAMGHPRGMYGFNDLNFFAALSIPRLYINTDIRDVSCSLNLDNGTMALSAEASVNDKLSASLKTTINAQRDTLDLSLEKLTVKYNLFELRNKKIASFAYRDGDLSIRDFELWRNDSRIALNGTFSERGEQNLRLQVERFKGYDLTFNFLNVPEIDVIDYDLFLDATINGRLNSPKFVLDLRADSMFYKKANIGSFKSKISYADRELHTDTRFIDNSAAGGNSRLTLTGAIPINLALGEVKERLISARNLDVSLNADNFNIGAFGDIVPSVTNMRGFLNARVTLKGTYNAPSQQGYMNLRDGGFKLNYNNLEYGAGMHVTLNERKLIVDSVTVFNTGKTKTRGTIMGSGEVSLEQDNSISALIRLRGDLAVLAKESRSAGSVINGDLFIATDGDITYSQSGGKSFLSAPIIVKEGDLTFSPKQTGYRTSSDNFFYRLPSRNISLSARELEIKRLLEAGEERRAMNMEKKNNIAGLDYEIQVRMQNEATFVFVLSPETNQKLNANLRGELFFEQKSGIQNFQGELKVLEGSTLEFIKTFSATGTLRFESDVTNPNLDITGLYKAYYSESDSAAAVNLKEEEVAVKLKIKGPLNDLTKNFTKNDDNLGVYYGKTNIEKDTPSPEFDKADAIWFILMGKFKKDLTQQDKSSAAGQLDPITGTATSLASSFVGSILNTYVGDAVRSIEIRNLGANTKFNLSGRFKKFRYTLGGSTNFLQDLSSANMRVEYPLFDNFLIRVERKEANTQANYQNEMMNEFGLRYRFQF